MGLADSYNQEKKIERKYLPSSSISFSIQAAFLVKLDDLWG